MGDQDDKPTYVGTIFCETHNKSGHLVYSNVNMYVIFCSL